MKAYLVTARTEASCIRFGALATSSGAAEHRGRALFGDEPCGVTVICLG